MHTSVDISKTNDDGTVFWRYQLNLHRKKMFISFDKWRCMAKIRYYWDIVKSVTSKDKFNSFSHVDIIPSPTLDQPILILRWIHYIFNNIFRKSWLSKRIPVKHMTISSSAGPVSASINKTLAQHCPDNVCLLYMYLWTIMVDFRRWHVVAIFWL